VCWSTTAWGKTGTTEANGDAWFIGFNRKLTTAVWMGYPEGQSVPLLNVHGVAKVNGGSLPADIWRRFMSRAAPDQGNFPIPTSFDGRPINDSGILPYSTPTSSTVPSKSGSSDSSDSSDDSGTNRRTTPTSKPDADATPPSTAATDDTQPPRPQATSPPATEVSARCQALTRAGLPC